MSVTDRHVVIVGGGVAGLATAAALHRQGISAVMLERQETVPNTGFALNLPGNAIRALATLGVSDELAVIGAPIRRREYRNERGRLLFAVDEQDFWGPDVTSRCVRRSDLLDLLARLVPAEAVRRDCPVASIEQPDGSDQVRVVLGDGSASFCDLVVGADGVHSTVRREIAREYAPKSALISGASWRFMAPNPGIGCWTVWSGRRDTFLLIPVGGDEVYGWAATAGGESPGALREAFAAFPAPVPETLEAALSHRTAPYRSPLEEVRLPRWSRDRVLLIGDAAHATAPVLAQGAGLAAEDALTVAHLLATQADWADVGGEYERRRRDRVQHVQAMTDRMSRLAAMPTWLRDTVTPRLGPRGYRAAYAPLRTPVVA